MATQNFALSRTWQKIVDASATSFLVSTIAHGNRIVFELATSDTETAPTVTQGHPVDPSNNEGATRADVGPGYVYARIPFGSSMTIAVTAWS